ncbi:site-2 protease family protein [Lusitaniella coriacea LEGE 07157]|uniref:Site-2 protease family protein n=1 Tax=Lusitaniella coriacea LEGE 07157 TaxID=945747 RepID=A0A8J7B379_9CYAN|nr:site-2 protease family protein [Lusitaniella coriacea]MBE9114857.1 site-2 protease family protein [Lusitaniella coriacea LEGE 07157]
MEWLLLILLGLFTYTMVKRSVARLTQTPLWMLWLALMTPAILWKAWSVVMQEELPIGLAIGTLIACPLLYLWLIQQGRREEPASQTQTPFQEDTLERDREESKKKLRPITTEEEKRLRNCFPWGTYYLQHLDYHPQAILCRGKLRSNPDAAYQTIRENIESKFGDRFLIIFQEGLPNQPFFALVPNPWAKDQNRPDERLNRPLLALALFFITLFTMTIFGGVVEIDREAPALVYENLEALKLAFLYYSVPFIAILSAHELSHYFMAIRYNIRTTLPYFIPMPLPIGTLGPFVQMKSPVPHRKALFDIAIAGPIGGFLVTLPLLLWGLSLSEVVPLSETAGIVDLESLALNPRFSFLFSILSKLALGSRLAPDTAIDLHPLAIAGSLGIMVTALNLMPVGKLDGGHIVHAMFGQRMAVAIGQVTRLLMLPLAFFQKGFFVFWAITLLFMPLTDEPALNDVTDLNSGRDLLGLLALALLAIILLPLPGAVAQWMNI